MTYKGGANYTMMRMHIFIDQDQLGKPFWERKLTGENKSRDDPDWKEFSGWYYLITRMISALYTKEILRSWYRDDKMKGKQLWELVTFSF